MTILDIYTHLDYVKTVGMYKHLDYDKTGHVYTFRLTRLDMYTHFDYVILDMYTDLDCQDWTYIHI